MQEKHNARRVVCQGEIIDPSVQGNKYLAEPRTFFVFNLIIDGKKLSIVKIIEELSGSGLQSVPYLGEYTFTTCEDLLKHVEGKSLINPKAEREGSVFRSGETSFKGISNKFLLQEKD